MTATADPQDPYILAPYEGQCPPAPEWFGNVLNNAPERSRFKHDGADIELLTWGDIGQPGLLFLHGNGAHADWWSHIAPFFASQWRCAALSLSGMGRSDRRPDGYTVPGFAAEALAAIKVAGLDRGPRPPVVIGHSFGGGVGVELAAHTGAELHALVLVDTPLNLAPEQLEAARARAPKPRSSHRVFASKDEGITSFRLSPPQPCNNHFVADHIARHSLIEAEGGWSWHFDVRRVTIDAKRGVAAAAAIRCPTAYIYGERSVLVTPDNLARAVNVLPQGAPVIGIPDAAHHVLVDQPLALVSALRGLLASWPG